MLLRVVSKRSKMGDETEVKSRPTSDSTELDAWDPKSGVKPIFKDSPPSLGLGVSGKWGEL